MSKRGRDLSSQHLRRWIWYLVAATRGGATRAKIIQLLKERPMNINELAEAMKMHYTTLMYHVKILTKNGLLTSVGEKYAVTYFLSEELEANYDIFLEILEKAKKKADKR